MATFPAALETELDFVLKPLEQVKALGAVVLGELGSHYSQGC